MADVVTLRDARIEGCVDRMVESSGGASGLLKKATGSKTCVALNRAAHLHSALHGAASLACISRELIPSSFRSSRTPRLGTRRTKLL